MRRSSPRQKKIAENLARLNVDTAADAHPNGNGGLLAVESEPEHTARPVFAPSAEPSSISKKQYSRPANVRELAWQASDVATRLLNGTIDLETARAYGSIVRTVAQAMSAQVQQSRIMRQEPDLTFGGEE